MQNRNTKKAYAYQNQLVNTLVKAIDDNNHKSAEEVLDNPEFSLQVCFSYSTFSDENGNNILMRSVQLGRHDISMAILNHTSFDYNWIDRENFDGNNVIAIAINSNHVSILPTIFKLYDDAWILTSGLFQSNSLHTALRMANVEAIRAIKNTNKYKELIEREIPNHRYYYYLHDALDGMQRIQSDEIKQEFESLALQLLPGITPQEFKDEIRDNPEINIITLAKSVGSKKLLDEILKTFPDNKSAEEPKMTRNSKVSASTWQAIKPIYSNQNQTSNPSSTQSANKTSIARERSNNNVHFMATNALKKYIDRIESHKNGANPDFHYFKFPFFKNSRAANRRANYLLAKQLVKKVNVLIPGDDYQSNLREIFANIPNERLNIITENKINEMPDYSNRGIRSSELNKVISLVMSTTAAKMKK